MIGFYSYELQVAGISFTLQKYQSEWDFGGSGDLG
jgi:hypothetical protein